MRTDYRSASSIARSSLRTQEMCWSNPSSIGSSSSSSTGLPIANAHNMHSVEGLSQRGLAKLESLSHRLRRFSNRPSVTLSVGVGRLVARRSRVRMHDATTWMRQSCCAKCARGAGRERNKWRNARTSMCNLDYAVTRSVSRHSRRVITDGSRQRLRYHGLKTQLVSELPKATKEIARLHLHR
jgi:hypothetical protein